MNRGIVGIGITIALSIIVIICNLVRAQGKIGSVISLKNAELVSSMETPLKTENMVRTCVVGFPIEKYCTDKHRRLQGVCLHRYGVIGIRIGILRTQKILLPICTTTE